MAKVIRTARLSEQPYRLRVRTDRQEGDDAPEDAPDDADAQVLNGESAEASEDALAAEEEASEAAEQGGDSDEGASVEAAGDVEAGPPAAEPPPEATFSALQVETLVEERLKEFEVRFQQEKEAAYRAGFEDGRTEGLKEGQEQSRSEIDRFQALAEDLNARWQDLMKQTDVDLMDLAMAVAQRIIGAAVTVRKEPVLQTVQECLGYLQDKTRVVIKVHPDDLETVRRHRNDWLESLESMEQLIIEGDSEISRGGCVIETPVGDVDAQIEERLEKLRTVLMEEIRAGDEDE